MSGDDTRTWPVGLRRLAELIGAAGAMRLAERFGGLENLYVPRQPRRNHPWVPLIGYDAMRRLCAEFGPGHIDIPKGSYRDLKKVQILDSAGSNSQVAVRVKATQRYVRRVRSQHRAPRERDLFDPPTD
jgi:hypothetical protein